MQQCFEMSCRRSQAVVAVIGGTAMRGNWQCLTGGSSGQLGRPHLCSALRALCGAFAAA